MNFDAKEIERQAGRIDDQLLIFSSKMKIVIDSLDQMSTITKSEDSALSTELNEYYETYLTLQSSLSTNFKMLSNTMHTYASKTIKNEESLTSDVVSANTELETVNSMLNTVNDDWIINMKFD